tara:strand:- start:941 stop:1465 length:525 start_codon:yes stop_codon:yes gene_type:complete
MDEDKGKSMLWIFIVMGISLYIAYNWDNITLIKYLVGKVLDPTFGALLDWNIYFGFTIVIAFTSLALTLSQKYFSDQESLREIKEEQKYLQKEMKEYRDHPEKLLELQKKQFEIIPKSFHITMQPMIYTGIPVILLFRWFSDYLMPIFGNWWILFYMIGAVIFSMIFRKMFNVA